MTIIKLFIEHTGPDHHAYSVCIRIPSHFRHPHTHLLTLGLSKSECNNPNCLTNSKFCFDFSVGLWYISPANLIGDWVVFFWLCRFSWKMRWEKWGKVFSSPLFTQKNRHNKKSPICSSSYRHAKKFWYLVIFFIVVEIPAKKFVVFEAGASPRMKMRRNLLGNFDHIQKNPSFAVPFSNSASSWQRQKPQRSFGYSARSNIHAMAHIFRYSKFELRGFLLRTFLYQPLKTPFSSVGWFDKRNTMENSSVMFVLFLVLTCHCCKKGPTIAFAWRELTQIFLQNR